MLFSLHLHTFVNEKELNAYTPRFTGKYPCFIEITDGKITEEIQNRPLATPNYALYFYEIIKRVNRPMNSMACLLMVDNKEEMKDRGDDLLVNGDQLTWSEWDKDDWEWQ